MSEEINKMLDGLIDDFRSILNKYIDLLETIKDYHENLSEIQINAHKNKKDWEQAMSIFFKYFQ